MQGPWGRRSPSPSCHVCDTGFAVAELPGEMLTGTIDALSLRSHEGPVEVVTVRTVQGILNELVLTKKEVVKLTFTCVQIIKLLSPREITIRCEVTSLSLTSLPKNNEDCT